MEVDYNFILLIFYVLKIICVALEDVRRQGELISNRLGKQFHVTIRRAEFYWVITILKYCIDLDSCEAT